MRNSSSTILTFLAGAAVGALLGILYAPDTGSNTRDKLSYRLSKYYESLKELLGKLREEGGDATATGPKASGNQAQEYRKAEALLLEVESLLDDMKQKGKTQG